ncbi:hypothetical protein CDAR_421491 [Caerostris darwini]|uniref:MATH domain-containing protein n=1 Tax=Caerostris darwini TaxID=1538125 RepID=A0AAV4SYW5_9ARAC|nr:hypothetical protein CDAR_421491 [Caerostris darwini]
MEENKVDEFIFTWVIENFIFCSQRDVLPSPIFIANNIEETKWVVLLYPRGWTDTNYIAVCLKNMDDDPIERGINIEFQLTDGSETLTTSKVDNHLFNKKSACTFPNYFPRNAISRSDKVRDVFLPGGNLRLRVRL